MQIDRLYQLFLRHPKVTTDSRMKTDGDMFFALKGEQFDGNLFAAKALENGAGYAVVDNPEVQADDRYILVDDVLTALQNLARYHRQQFTIPVIAVTGTNGKTTTKELIKKVLSTQNQVIATENNLNNHIGVPRTLLNINRQTQIAIIEMGANHRNEINTLCNIALPTHGLITNIGKAHLEGFGGEEGVKLAKKELYDYLEQHNGIIFYNDDNPILTGILSKMSVEKIAYQQYCRGQVLSAAPYLRMMLHINGVGNDLQTQMAGAYNCENVLAAACVGGFFGTSPDRIVSALADYCPQNNRSQLVQTRRNRLVLDYYNANPSSMKASLENFLGQFSNKMVILGDMFELGEASLSEHQEIIRLLASHPEVTSVVVGKNFAQAAKTSNILAFENVEILKSWLTANPPDGKSILVKASRGMKLEQLQELL
ncbi:MAG: UDP-N-acetylmuramoyl-tripeptide--D-alanyl-D-alanine ligase [Bacteroidales bacterium]|jgi:UDP-N-acetylmuramoyl-tripeptide--D-alanyl-D-alanine ligase|nr:UDP-N-acetylmuramoyl-tripeptide--D-alanyl-D-alanine ligase [Bacteroidales bacterium]